MALKENLVAAAGVAGASEEVVQTHLVERRGTGVGGDVTTDADVRTLRALHQDGGVPAQEPTVGPLGVLVTREGRLLRHRDGVDVVGRDGLGARQTGGGRLLTEPAQHGRRPLGPIALEQLGKGLRPLRHLFGVDLVAPGS